jgi:two-component system cell cycle sensor histidine kinase/response regulator CckA
MPPNTNSAVILVVDDEPLVLTAVAAMLGYSGFTVLRAGLADEALRIGAGQRQRIDVMLSDVLMPGMTGPALAEEFSKLHPETRYLFMAGFAQHPEVVDRILKRGLAFIGKPFLPNELLWKVKQVLAPAPEFAAGAGA